MTTSPQSNTLINAAKNPTSTNLQELATLPMQNIPIPETARQVGQAAFESQVQPFRRGFGERLEKTTGELARRGIAFGGATAPGAQQVKTLIESEQQLEADIAGRIGSQLGLTLQEQAFQSSEMAKRFEESKEFAEFTQGLKFGTDAQGKPVTQLEAQKELAKFGATLDVETQTQLADLSLKNQKDLFEFTSNLDQTQKKDFAEFMTNLDTQSRKDFLEFSTALDSNTKKDLATFMSNLDTEAQKDMAGFLTNLETDAAKDMATFTANLDYDTQTKFMDYGQSLKGGTDEFGNALTDVEIAQKMSDISTNASKTMFSFQNAASRGVNPETGQAYTDFDMANMAADLEITRAERATDLQKDLSEHMAILDRGADEDGNPLDQNAFNELTLKMQNRLNTEFATKAFEAAAIAEYGANGIEIANQIAQTRGDSMADDMSMLEAIDADNGLTDAEKSDLTKLILSGAGWESEPVRNVIENSNSQVVGRDFMSSPPAETTLRNASSELKDYLSTKGFGYNEFRKGGLFGLGEQYGWDMWTGENEINKFNELWNNDQEFRRMVKRG